MSVLLPLSAIVVFLVGAVVWKVRDNARASAAARDEMLRAGGTAEETGDSAARRAGGTAAWARMSDPSGP